MALLKTGRVSMADDIVKVRLEIAFSWKCPTCGKRNFVRSVPFEWTDDDLRAHMGLQSWEPIPQEVRESTECVSAPKKVTCGCGAKFDTLDPYQEDNI
jgi:hypothetical protein